MRTAASSPLADERATGACTDRKPCARQGCAWSQLERRCPREESLRQLAFASGNQLQEGFSASHGAKRIEATFQKPLQRAQSGRRSRPSHQPQGVTQHGPACEAVQCAAHRDHQVDLLLAAVVPWVAYMYRGALWPTLCAPAVETVDATAAEPTQQQQPEDLIGSN